MRTLLGIAFVLIVAAGCGGAGPYGHSPQYAPLAEEEKAAAGARDYDPVMFQRIPEEWHKKATSLFGVVTSRAPGPSGGAYVTLSVRRLEPRNLCDNMHDDDSCRVTVSDKDFGVVHAVLGLRGEDDVGASSVGPGSLVRAIGIFGQDVDAADGAPVLRATYYRHWPRGSYVTRAAARDMRQ